MRASVLRACPIILVLAVAGVASLLAMSTSISSPAAGRAAKAETHLLCLNGDGISEYRRKDRPKQCTIFGQGGIFAGGVNLKKLKWRGWGHKRARANGIECGFHLPCQNIKAKVRVWRPRERCGKRVYTRLRARTRYGHSRADVQGCPGPVFRPVATPSRKPRGASGKPEVACWNNSFPGEPGAEPQFYRAPRKCRIFRRGATSIAEGDAIGDRLRWRWGFRKARGSGRVYVSSAGMQPGKLKLTKPVMSCGRLVFSKVRARIDPKPQGVDSYHYSFRIYTC
jgi:hypothetical protein